MKKILLILLIGIIAFTSCDSPKSNGEKLGNKLCECLTATQNEANCKAEIDKLTSDYKEKYKNSPSDLMQFISGYTSVSLNCLGKIGEQSLNKLSKISYTGGNENIQTEDYDKAVEALSKISESSKPSSSFSLQGITVKYIFFCVLLILCGVLMNMYGERKFGLSLSLSFMIIWMCLFSMINFIGATTAVIIITFSVMIYIFYKPFMYFFTWFYLAVLIAMILYLPITLFAATKTYPTFISYIALAASAIFIYFKRYHLKRITITFIGGISLGLGLAGIVSYQQFSSGNYWNALTLPFTIIALCVLGSLIYQYKDKLFKSKNVTELTNDITSDDTNNVNNNTINNKIAQSITIKKPTIKLTTKQIQIAGVSAVILIGVGIGLYFFLNNNTQSNNLAASNLNNAVLDSVQNNTIKEIPQTENKQNVPTLEESAEENNSESYINRDPNEGNEHTQQDVYEAAQNVLTPYKAQFGNSEIKIVIEEITQDGKVKSAYNIFKGKKTNMTGTYSGTFTRGEMCNFLFTLQEPKGNSNGIFELYLGAGSFYGTWKSYNGKLTREFELENDEEL